MGRPIMWLRERPVVSFFLLTLAVNYVLLFPVVLLRDSVDQSLVAILVIYAPRLAVYSPVLVGMLIARWLRPARTSTSVRRRRIIFGLVWLVALAVYVLETRDGYAEFGIGLETVIPLSMPIALLPAFVVSGALSRITGIKEYLSSLIRPRGHFVWYLVALFTFPMVHLTGYLVTRLVTSEPLFADIRLTSEVLGGALAAFAFVFFFSGGINEEGGWRGFAQNRLQQTYSPLTANLVLYLYLVVWHIPYDIVQYADGGYLRVRIALYPFIVVLFGWVYNRTNGSIPAVALFHASMNSMNVMGEAIPATTAAFAFLVLFALYAVTRDRMWQKPATQGDVRDPLLEPPVLVASGNP
jgi:membrane protease YdiL (CAAX protease family)